jgi:hypothetical protein
VAVSAIGITASNAPQSTQTAVLGTFSYIGSSAGFGTEISSLTTSITPRSNTSKVLVSIVINYSTITSNSKLIVFRLTRNGVEIGSSTAGGNPGIACAGYEDGEVEMINNTKIEFLDSPSSSSAVTYKLFACCYGSAATLYLNQPNPGAAVPNRTSSFMILQEFFA